MLYRDTWQEIAGWETYRGCLYGAADVPLTLKHYAGTAPGGFLRFPETSQVFLGD